MSQIVPTAGFTPPYCDYNAFTTDFDLSLLPASPDSEVPLSPTVLSSIHFFSSIEDAFCGDSFGFSFDTKPDLKPNIQKQEEKQLKDTLYNEEMDKNEFEEALKCMKKEKDEGPLIPTTVHCQQFNYSTTTVKEEPASYMPSSEFTDPMSPPSSTRVPTTHIPLSSPCSPSTSQPYQSRSMPPSPFKVEKTVDLQEILKESQMLQSVVRGDTSPSRNFPTLQNLLKKGEEKSDHILLRSVLRDTSFQRKMNARPYDVDETGEKKSEDGGSGSTEMVEELTRERIEPVLSLAIEQLRKDIDNTCFVLGISTDPTQWSEADVKSWLLWTVQQLTLPLISIEFFNMDGAALSQLSEVDFQQRCPQSGSILHAQLEVWKAASFGECSSEQNVEYQRSQWSPTMHSSSSSTGEISDEEEEEMDTAPAPTSATPTATTEKEAQPASTSSTPATKSRTGGGSHIHLWQFLKELLASPQVHGSCIRWTDRQKGVFKIEDSVRVARLWGLRKNRPAMNYDKLSRSIRQYYKKGIMKKTERSQRLVYQFCHPYSL